MACWVAGWLALSLVCVNHFGKKERDRESVCVLCVYMSVMRCVCVCVPLCMCVYVLVLYIIDMLKYG